MTSQNPAAHHPRGDGTTLTPGATPLSPHPAHSPHAPHIPPPVPLPEVRADLPPTDPSTDVVLRGLQAQLELMSRELRASRARFRILFEALPMGAVITDGFGAVRAVNTKAAEMLGAGVIGRSLLVCVPEHERGLVRTRVVRARLGEPAAWVGTIVSGMGREDAGVPAAFTVTPLGEAPEALEADGAFGAGWAGGTDAPVQPEYLGAALDAAAGEGLIRKVQARVHRP